MSTTPSTPSTPTTPSTPGSPREESLAHEVFDDDARTTELPATGAARPGTAATTAAPARSPEPTYLKGPAPFAIVLGLLGLVVAGATLLSELTDLTVPWDDLGPWSVVAAGIVVLLVGALGLRASRTQD